MWLFRSHLALTLEPTGPSHTVMICHIMAYLHLLIPPDSIPAELCLNALSLQGLYVPRSLRRAFPKHSTHHMQEGLMLGAIRSSTLQLSSGTRTRWVVLLTALLVAL